MHDAEVAEQEHDHRDSEQIRDHVRRASVRVLGRIVSETGNDRQKQKDTISVHLFNFQGPSSTSDTYLCIYRDSSRVQAAGRSYLG